MAKAPKKQALQKNQASLDKLQHEHLYEKWLDEVSKNPHFSDETMAKDGLVKEYFKTVLDQIVNALSYNTMPQLPKEAFQPLRHLWESIKKVADQKGLGTKDTALFIFSLKACLQQWSDDEDYSHFDPKAQQQMHAILDFLGLLTFETYAAKQEEHIGLQQEQISYLQGNQAFGVLIGKSEAMAAVYRAIGLVLENDVSVLLQGESGTGKDVIASVIHTHSKRNKGPFITLNCASIPKDLLESELFGYEKGSFTGAEKQKIGKIELAHEGTLFLDEISELSLEMQAKLLRVLQNREIDRIGSTKKIPINIRVIAATNADLQEAVQQKQFRLDLFYRLNVFPIFVPPLRERDADVLELAFYFIKKYAQILGVKEASLSKDAKAYLLNQPWPGNVRELENMLQRALLLASKGVINADMLSYQPGKQSLALSAGDLALPLGASDSLRLEDVEKHAILKVLDLKKGNVKQAAEALGVSRTTLYNKSKKYDIEL